MVKLVSSSPLGKEFYQLSPEDRLQGLLVLGQPGMGQEDLFFNLLIQDIQLGNSLALLDSQGRFLPKLLDYVPKSLSNKLIYLDFADQEFPIAFNLLEKGPPQERVLVKEGLLMALEALFGDSWGPRLEYILSYTIMALLEYPGSTLLSVQELLVDEGYRQRVLKKVQDPFVRYFFLSEFSQYSERFRQEAIAPIQNKIGQFLLDPLLRHLVCQSRNKVPVSEVLSQGKILLARLPRAEIGATASRLLGTILLVRLLQAGLQSNSNLPLSLYVPELSLFASPGLASLLEQASNGRINLILAAPSLFTLEGKLRGALLTNLKLLLCFCLAPDDARLISKDSEPHYRYSDLLDLGPGEVIFRPLNQGYPSRIWSKGYVRVLGKRVPLSQSQREKIIRVSRERYATPRVQLEEKLSRHLDQAILSIQKRTKRS